MLPRWPRESAADVAHAPVRGSFFAPFRDLRAASFFHVWEGTAMGIKMAINRRQTSSRNSASSPCLPICPVNRTQATVAILRMWKQFGSFINQYDPDWVFPELMGA